MRMFFFPGEFVRYSHERSSIFGSDSTLMHMFVRYRGMFEDRAVVEFADGETHMVPFGRLSIVDPLTEPSVPTPPVAP